MKKIDFRDVRRQPYLDESSYKNTLAHIASAQQDYAEVLADPPYSSAVREAYQLMAADSLDSFMLRFTGGERLEDLATQLESVVEAYERYVEQCNLVPDAEYFPPFRFDDIIDNYVDFVNILGFSVLLHREDLVGRIAMFNFETEYDFSDAIIEDVLKFFIPGRPNPDQWLWDVPYGKLLEAIDATSLDAKKRGMKKYVEGWYSSMKGRAHFWGKHEQIADEFSPYFGYWAVCAAVFTYLYDLDDSSYRDELVYPKDLVDYARSIPRRAVKLEDGTELLRVAGGQPCPRAGNWFSPAKDGSGRHFNEGEHMPSFDASEYGQTIWQWSPNI
jgi:hypothetical protein